MKYTVTILLADGTSRTGIREFTSTAKITEYQDVEARGYFRGVAEGKLGAARIKQVQVSRLPETSAAYRMPTGGHHESSRYKGSPRDQTNFNPYKPKPR